MSSIALDVVALGIVIADIAFILFLFYSEKSNPQKIIPWALAFLILPVVGFVLYIFLGQTLYSSHVFKVKSIDDEQLRKDAELQDRIFDNDTECAEYAAVGRTMYRCGSGNYSHNNDVRFYSLGQTKFDDLFEDLRNAKDFIHFEYYIIRNDELGNELFDILIRKQKEGVEVKLLTDAVGFGSGPKKRIRELREAGGEFKCFHSVVTLILSPKKNNRNHRKLAVIDGEIAYCGGFNVGDEYLGKGPFGYWRDSAARYEGGAAWSVEARFIMDWNYATGGGFEGKDLERYFGDSVIGKPAATRCCFISGGPDVAYENPIRKQYVQMINLAKETVYIHSPYFIPDASVRDALSLAVARGVDVRIIIPDKPDHPFVYWNNISSAYEVMKNGVKVYQYNRGFVHSKTMVVDSEYCSIGSANFDDRSLVLNFESNMLVFSKDVGKEMTDAYLEDLSYSTEYTCKDFESLGFGKRTKVAFSRLFKNLE